MAQQLYCVHLDSTENLRVNNNTKYQNQTEAAEDYDLDFSNVPMWEDGDVEEKITIPSPRPSEVDKHGRPSEETFKLVVEPQPKIMEHTQMIRLNLQQQQLEIEKQIALLEGQLNKQKEYLAKIEGGIDVLDELAKA